MRFYATRSSFLYLFRAFFSWLQCQDWVALRHAVLHGVLRGAQLLAGSKGLRGRVVGMPHWPALECWDDPSEPEGFVGQGPLTKLVANQSLSSIFLEFGRLVFMLARWISS